MGIKSLRKNNQPAKRFLWTFVKQIFNGASSINTSQSSNYILYLEKIGQTDTRWGRIWQLRIVIAKFLIRRSKMKAYCWLARLCCQAFPAMLLVGWIPPKDLLLVGVAVLPGCSRHAICRLNSSAWGKSNSAGPLRLHYL